MEERDQLLRVCSLLNAQGARYLVAGGHACILHGHVRTTEDVDILVEDSIENFQRLIAGLSAPASRIAPETYWKLKRGRRRGELQRVISLGSIGFKNCIPPFLNTVTRPFDVSFSTI